MSVIDQINVYNKKWYSGKNWHPVETAKFSKIFLFIFTLIV